MSSDENRLFTRRHARREYRLIRALRHSLQSLEPRRLLSPPYDWQLVGIGGTATSYGANVNPNNTHDIP